MSHDAALIAARNRIRDLADRLGSRDDVALEHAARHLSNGQPAYWSAVGCHNQAAANLNAYANRHAGLMAGLAAIEEDLPHRNWRDAARLDTLLPLNPAAVADLAAAYREAGRFRRRAELMARTAGHEMPAGREAAA